MYKLEEALRGQTPSNGTMGWLLQKRTGSSVNDNSEEWGGGKEAGIVSKWQSEGKGTLSYLSSTAQG